MSRIGVIGAGAFGTALGICFARKTPTLLWARDAEQAACMQRERRNFKRLPGATLPEGLTATGELPDLSDAEILVLALPAQMTASFLNASGRDLPDVPVVLAAKGISVDGLELQTDIASRWLAAPLAVLTGPGFASEIANGLPTALTLAARDRKIGRNLQEALSTETLRLYLSSDPVGAQIGGALKNVIALACGIAIGSGLGESARAALMTRGFFEMSRLALAMGGQAETLSGLSGLGDLALTCGTEQSRNFSAGLRFGQAGQVSPGTTVEGLATARAASALADSEAIEMPIVRAVSAILDGQISVSSAMQDLLSRPLKEEH